MSVILQKKCAECGTPIVGRVDKRFCSDQCRNTFNNRINSDLTTHMRNTNNVLRRNRRILLELSHHGIILIRRDLLLARGFDFNHFTSCSVRGRVQFFYCYELGYFRPKKNYFRLVIKKEFMK